MKWYRHLTRRGVFLACCCWIVMVVIPVFFTPAASVADAGLPATAEQSMNEGLNAAQSGNWPEAIKHFRAAQQQAPASPEILFNLALALDKAGGRELAAVTWYNAYLAANPGSADTGQVRTQIEKLKDGARGKAADLLQAAVSSVLLETEKNALLNALTNLVEVQANTGDFIGGLASAQKITSEPYISYSYFFLCRGQADAGDIVGAQRSVLKISQQGQKNQALRYIVRGQAKAGDIKGATATAASIADTAQKGYAYAYIATAHAEGDNLPAARDFIAKAKNEIASLPANDTVKRFNVRQEVIKAMIKTGDPAAARQNIDANIKAVESVNDGYAHAWGFSTVAEVQALAGDFAGAKALVDLARVAVPTITDQEKKTEASLQVEKAARLIGPFTFDKIRRHWINYATYGLSQYVLTDFEGFMNWIKNGIEKDKYYSSRISWPMADGAEEIHKRLNEIEEQEKWWIEKMATGSIAVAAPVPATPAIPPQPTAAAADTSPPEKGWLGISIAKLTPEASKAAGQSVASGVLVAGVLPEGAAGAAGIMKGDIILRINGVQVNEPADIVRLISQHSPSQRVSLIFFAKGGEQEIVVTLGRRPKPQTTSAKPAPASEEGWLGVFISEAKPTQQIFISEIFDGGPASKADLMYGDIIVRVNGQDIKTYEAFKTITSAFGPGESVQLDILRQGSEKSVTATMTTLPRFISYLRKGIDQIKKGEVDAGIGSLQESLLLEPDQWLTLYWLGSAQMEKKNHIAAILALRDSIRLKPNFAGGRAALALAYAARGDRDRALQEQKWLKKNNYPLSEKLLVEINQIGQKPDAKTETPVKSSQTTPAKTPAPVPPPVASAADRNAAQKHTDEAFAYMDKKWNDAALASFKEAVRLDPNNHIWHANLGNMYSMLGKTDSSVAALEEAVRIKPDYASGWANLGVSYSSAGRPADSVAAYEKAVSLEPNLEFARSNLAHAYMKINEQQKAMEQYQYLKKINSNMATDALYQKITGASGQTSSAGTGSIPSQP